MKKIFLLFVLLASLFTAQAQVGVNDSVSLGANYTNMSFYSLANGEQANVNAKDWDLQFWTSLMDASIRVNDGASVSLFQLQNDDTATWNSVDTAGMTPLYNSDTSWAKGAFNVLASAQFDYGWGEYDQVSHNVKGKRIFVVKTLNGNFKKIWIKWLTNGVNYDIRISNLDNSNEETISLNKSDYPGKEFFYYAIDSAEVKDIEPAQTAWDLVFRRYQTFVSFPLPQYYTVMGVLSNPVVSVAEAVGVDVTSNDTTGMLFDDNISVIGSDWKTINMNVNPPVYDITDSLAYFVAAQDGNIYKVVFTKFLYSPTGKVVFSKTQLPPPATAVSEISNLQSLIIYPNPAAANIQTLFTLENETNVTVRVLDLAGKSHLNIPTQGHTGLNSLNLNVAELSQGFYLLSVDDGNNKLTYKFVKN